MSRAGCTRLKLGVCGLGGIALTVAVFCSLSRPRTPASHEGPQLRPAVATAEVPSGAFSDHLGWAAGGMAFLVPDDYLLLPVGTRLVLVRVALAKAPLWKTCDASVQIRDTAMAWERGWVAVGGECSGGPAGAGAIDVVDVRTWRQVHHISTAAPVLCLDLSHDGRWLAYGDADGRVAVSALGEDSSYAEEWARLTGGRVRDIAVSATGRRLVYAGGVGADLIDVRTGALVCHLVHRQAVPAAGETPLSTVALSSNGRFAATATAEAYLPHRVLLWDARTGRLVRSLEQAPGAGRVCVTFDPQSRRVVASGSLRSGGDRRRPARAGDAVLCVWDADSGHLIDRWRVASSDITAIAIAPGGDRLAARIDSTPGLVRVWDLQSLTLGP